MCIEIPSDVNFLIDRLCGSGYMAYAVGGCVRDCIIGRQPDDWDICTSAVPDEVIGVFADFDLICTGRRHGTITVVIDDKKYEVTTFRIDGNYTDNRRPDSVEFTTDIIQDLSRRDFTVNAIAFNNTDGLIDPFGGAEDIKKKLIRCVGDAKLRFGEDSLRIVRAVRFAAKLGFNIEQSTAGQIHMQCQSIKNISAERFREELCKIAVSDGFADVLKDYTDVFKVFIPELGYCENFAQNNPYHIYDVFKHTVSVVKNCDSDDVVVRLAALFHDIGKPHSYQDDNGIRHFLGHSAKSGKMTGDIMRRLKFSNACTAQVTELVKYHDVQLENNDRCIKRWLSKIGEKQFDRLMCLKKADISGQNPKMLDDGILKIDGIRQRALKIITQSECISLKELNISGSDIIAAGCPRDKTVGIILNKLLEMVIDEKAENNREELLKQAEMLLEQIH